MKLHILSDLHFEFQKWPARIDVNEIDADVTILAGDIGIGLQGIQWALDHFRRPVIYVMGNHEYYGQRPMAKTLEKAKQKCAETHVHLLHDDCSVIDGVRFLGTTLWTDFALFGIESREAMMTNARATMTDYTVIYGVRRGRVIEPGVSLRRQGDLITPQTTLALHEKGRQFLEKQLTITENADGNAWKATVVVSHHAPSTRSLVDPSARSPDDAAYGSHLESLIQKTNLWVHGHTHKASDYRVGASRVVCNPRGYKDSGSEAVEGFDPCYVVEVRA
ncbi:MAG: metallophosphoesterase family protein [Propionivibrio sp.]